MKQLEEIVGRPLFRRHGRGITLTTSGERLLPTARRVTTSLDTALAELRDDGLRGKLRLGIPDDQSSGVLSRIIADFATLHPDVELQVHCMLGTSFERALQTGALDLAVFEVASPAKQDVILGRDELMWMCSATHALDDTKILPVALFDRDCWWRDLALADLEDAGRRYRIVFMSESTAGVRSAVHSGVAAALLGKRDAADGLMPLNDIGVRHESSLVLRSSAAASGAACDAMRDAIRRNFRLPGETGRSRKVAVKG